MSAGTRESSKTTEIPEFAEDFARAAIRRRRVVYAIATVVLAGLLLSVLVDGVNESLAIWGVDSRTVEAVAPGGVTVAVTYPDVGRPGLAAPFRVVVIDDGGFDGEIDLGFDADYLAMWDLNGIFPEPAETRSEGDRLVYTFDPPEGGDRFELFFDSRIEPSIQRGRPGYVALLEGGEPAAVVRFRTRVMP